MKIHSITVQPNLPENIKFLEELADNMWFSWNWQAIYLFYKIDPKLWSKSKRNPKWFLGTIDQSRLEEISKDADFLAHLNYVKDLFYKYKETDFWYKQNKKEQEHNFLTAYFSMEFGIGEGLPIYSGGLGMLAGDHIKSASDLGMPLIGVGLFYQRGYVKQVLNRDGWQNEEYPENDWAHMPVERVKDANGGELKIAIELGKEIIYAGVWAVSVGVTKLYLLDTNLQENTPEQRVITESLYGGDRENRIRQEVVLGIGGVKALKAMGITPTVYHINEGHSAFLLFQRIIDMMTEHKLTYQQACDVVWATSVFTTHTPVIAGNEHFDPALVRKYMEVYAQKMGLNWEDFVAIGKDEPNAPTFCMTVVALKLAAYLNGVSALHGRVSREMWEKVWPTLPVQEVPITSITNGIHSASWISHENAELYQKYSFNGADINHTDITKAETWAGIDNIPNNEFWQVHNIRKEKLIDTARKRLKHQLKRQGADDTLINKAGKILSADKLTIGFARRFATYKRANLLFRDLERLDRIVNNPDRPVQFVFAGKAHPADTAGKEFIKYIANIQNDPRFAGKLIFVEDYNMNLARYMVQGVDVWMNNPIRPLEASGTSGMKSALNGALTLSVLDGWWDEVGPCDFSWSIGGIENYKTDAERDFVESEALYNIIEQEIAPTYYDKDANGIPNTWIGYMKKSVKTIAPVFNTHRMVREYYDKFYTKAHYFFNLLSQEGKLAEISTQRVAIASNWYRVSITDISPKLETELKIGDSMKIRARVFLGALKPENVNVQLLLGVRGTTGDIISGQLTNMQHVDMEGDAYIYEINYVPQNSGRQDYSIRVMPNIPNVPNQYTPLFIRWEN
ncbi:starch phosphorylase [Elusimicrobium simillimum]|uniref:alpha-glucan family phosphorylase n=1 Tax=Elusimicrobium simillimum TaxID=3143438 RepID=UPI003C6EB5EA